MPDIILTDGTRLYDHLGLDGLLLGDPSQVADRPEVARLPMPGGLFAPFAGFGALFVRPDHVVAIAAPTGAVVTTAEVDVALGGVLHDRAQASR
jgi:hypothetical protein